LAVKVYAYYEVIIWKAKSEMNTSFLDDSKCQLLFLGCDLCNRILYLSLALLDKLLVRFDLGCSYPESCGQLSLAAAIQVWVSLNGDPSRREPRPTRARAYSAAPTRARRYQSNQWETRQSPLDWAPPCPRMKLRLMLE
jgi:hypothetical protein